MTLRRACILLIAMLVTAPGVRAAKDPTLPLEVRGTVVDAAGEPVRARLTVVGDHRASTTSNGLGEFSLTIPLPVAERLRAQPCTLGVYASARGVHFVLPNGDPTLSLALTVEPADSGARVVAHANDQGLAALAALTVGAGRPQAPVEGIRFLGLAGERIGEPPIAPVPNSAQVALGAFGTESPATQAAPGREDPAGGAGSRNETASAGASSRSTTKPARAATPPRRTRAGTSRASSSRGHVAPGSVAADSQSTSDSLRAAAAPLDSSATGAGRCGCRIKGTVELVSNPPPAEPVQVVLWIERHPEIRDTIDLDLGSPRAFGLIDVPCGVHHIALRVISRRPYYITDRAELDVRCGRSALIQPRIVLGAR